MTTTQAPSTKAAEPLVSVVIPCLNEAESIDACVRAALDTLANNEISGEVIVAHRPLPQRHPAGTADR